ncbi:non-ribosomal peptide synthetase [Pseudobacteroides cellulosolvens]|uniref:Amino acid adenylation domain protein n=1 Tax=Pseudobacteroides cellulosolvens ATCC 35603 = DSM 2933 TaxID=398512 RepID=A0A0L6JJC5_9FIRM|nr:non-ribosomal peptide synthetase [Pseudobacteroides cellulosolvens]KNY25840.1 amino acid adenylation domain protein [Pseudobacteroides cellulosolvens ATCC 35603 = DSM 2933]
MYTYRIINDQSNILNLYTNLAKIKEIPILLKLDHQQVHTKIIFNYKSGNNPIVSYINQGDLKIDDTIEMDFFYKECYFSFKSKITSILESSFRISIPEEVKICFLRNRSRYLLSAEEKAYIVLRGSDTKYEIIDISTSGFSFRTKEEILTQGSLVRNICLILNENTTLYVDGEVKYVKHTENEYRYGLNIVSLEWSTSQKIFGYLFEKTYPQIKSLTYYHMEELWKLYHKAKYLSKDLYLNDDNEFENYIKKLESFKDKSTLAINLIYQKSGKLLGVGTSLRIYRRTFLGYLPYIVPEAYLSPKAKTDIHIGLIENLLNHTYFENYISYFMDNLEWYKSIFEKIGCIIDDTNLYQLHLVKVFECTSEGMNKRLTANIYTTEAAVEASDFWEYCKNNMSQLEIQCFDYTKNSFYLDEIKEVYNSLDMTLLRKLFYVKEDDCIIAYAIAETCSYGENQRDYLDTVKVYLKENKININEFLSSLADEISLFYEINNKNKFTIILSDSSTENTFDTFYPALKGLEFMGSAVKVMMNRQGITEFSRLLTSNFETYSKYYPLTQPQKSIWFTEKVFPGTSIGNIIGSIKTKNELDFSLVEKSFNIIVEKNEGMRLRIIDEDGQQKQYVSQYKYFNVDTIDFRESGIESFYEWDEKEAQRPFNLYDSPLYYFAIIRLPQHTLLYFKTHHLISDAWTINLLGSHFIEVYDCLKNNNSTLFENKPSYLDFIMDEEEYKYSNKFDKNKAFWNEKFSTIPQLTEFEKDGLVPSTEAKRKTLVLSEELSSLLTCYCKEKKISVFSMFMSIISLYFSKLSGFNDIVLGTPILNRSGAKEKDTVGMFVSSIPVRLYADKDMDFRSYLLYVTKELSLCLKNQRYNYDMILNDYRKTHNIARGKLYDVVFSYQNAKYADSTENIDYEARWHFNKNQSDSLVIHVDDREEQGQFLINIDYLVNMFSKEDINKLCKRLIKLMKDVINCPDKKISNFNILSEDELSEAINMLESFNSTKFKFPKEKTIHELFEEQAALTPYSTALIANRTSITYKELNEKSNSLARNLRKLGVTPDTFVGIMDKPSIELIVGILAILKAGAAYLPIDPDYPDERVTYLLENCDVKFLLSRKYLCPAPLYKCETVYLEDEKSYDKDCSNLSKINSSSDLAYIIFTSGSTGNPKGVMIEHRNLVNQIVGLGEKLKFDSSYNHILLAKITFDVSVQHIFASLTTGAKLFIPDSEILKDADKFWRFVYDNKISVINTVPAYIDTLLDNINISSSHVFKYMMVGGDIFKKKLFDKIKSTVQVENIINIYGPTECTINATLYECPGDLNTNIIPIGKPLYNYSAMILDNSNFPVPVGVPGELCFSGDGIARGYLKAPELTNEKFVQNPIDPNSTTYRTGDLAKWLPDGNIEYIGRIDRQVKINGIRIELGEIESSLAACKGVKETFIMDVEDICSRKKQLCAYVVLEDKTDLSHLRKYLAEKLPSYMVPQYFVEMERFPLNTNGKIDKKKLPNPFEQNIEKSHYKPSNDIEVKLSKIAEKLLGVSDISTHDNLFDLGLDSIKMVTLVTSIKREFNINISFEEVHKDASIKGLSNYIMEREKENSISENLIPLAKGTNPDKHVFFIHSGSGEISTYMELCFKLNKEFNYWGIKMYGLEDLSPINITIDDLSDKYIKMIKKVQPLGPYYLFGWCIGGTIAFELALKLEREGDKVSFLALANTIPPMHWENIEYFDLQSEKLFLEKYFNIKADMYSSNHKTMKDLWEWAIEYFETNFMAATLKEILKNTVPKSVIYAIPKFEELNIREIVYYLNAIRTLHTLRANYFPCGKVNARVDFFKSTNDNIVDDENIWNNYCENKIEIYEVFGEHVTIFRSPYVNQFSKMLNNLLSRKI